MRNYVSNDFETSYLADGHLQDVVGMGYVDNKQSKGSVTITQGQAHLTKNLMSLG